MNLFQKNKQMKLNKILLLVIFVSTIYTANSQQRYHTGIVAFYNFENLYDTIDDDFVDDAEYLPNSTKQYNTDKYKIKLGNLEKVVSELGTDDNPDGPAILGVAEIENKGVLKDVVSQPKLKNRNYKIVHYDSRDARGIDVALIYNPKYYKVIKSEKITVDLNATGEKSFTRDILWVKGLFMGEELHVMVGHWPSRRGGEEVSKERRCLAAKAMRAKADSIFLENQNANVIVMGDLNDDPTSYSVVECLRASWKKEKATNGTLYNPFGDYYNKGIGTLAYNDAWNLFDQIIISPSILKNANGLQFHKSEIFNRPYLKNFTGQYKGYPFRTFAGDFFQGGFSDHFPTYIVIKKKAE
jgi:hypothetical protein